jgi:hypothetical protein
MVENGKKPALLVKGGLFEDRVVRSALGAVRGHAGVGVVQFGLDALGNGLNRRTDEREDQEAEADNSGGQNHPVNSHSAGFVVQEGRKLGHGGIPF